MKLLSKILWFFIYALPAVLFFSYHPVISLGANASMNFELSLPLIWLVFFDLGAFILLLILGWKQRHGSFELSLGSPAQRHDQPKSSSASKRSRPPLKTSAPPTASSRFFNFPGISDRRFFLLALLPLYLTLSILWSENRLRGLLTAGVMWLIFFAVFAMLYVLPLVSLPRRLRTHVLLVLFVSSILVCKFCYAQSVADVLGISRENTLLCAGCTYRAFGFPHPSGFAIEPQFMGNLLLAPTLTALYLVVFRPRKFAQTMKSEVDYVEHEVESKVLQNKIKLPQLNWGKWQVIGMTLLAGFLSMTLFFTFSRGAIYAYAVALIVLFIFALRRKLFRWSLITIPVVSFLLSLGLQGTFAAVGPTAETFVSAVTKSIHQLSLGIIDLRGQPVDNSASSVENQDNNCGKDVDKSQNTVDKTVDNCAKPKENSPDSVEKIAGIVDKAVEKHEEKSEQSVIRTTEDAIFEGYVAESTNIRLRLNQVAIWTWLSAPNRQGTFTIGLDCIHLDHPECNQSAKFTPTSFLFGVGLGGAGVAMHASYPDKVASSKEIVQHQGFSLLLETGLVGVCLMVFGLLIALFPQLFSRKFLDGRSAPVAQSTSTAKAKPGLATKTKPSATTKATSSPTPTNQTLPSFWHHPALPLLASLIVAYLVTLNFFSGLPNALQIYLMPPLLYLIFAKDYRFTTPKPQNPSRMI